MAIEDPNTFRPLNPSRTVDYGERPSLIDTVSAEMTKTFGATAYAIDSRLYYGSEVQEGYDSFDDMGEFKDRFASHLYSATGPEHMAFLKQGLREGIEARQVLNDAHGFKQFVASGVNPINLIALPFGGPALVSVNTLRTVATAGARTAAGVAVIETGAEIVLGWNDPLRTFEEQAMNVVSATVFGAGFGAAFSSVGVAAKKRAYTQSEKSTRAYFEMVERLERLDGLKPEDIAVPREQRFHGKSSDEDLLSAQRAFEAKLQAEQNKMNPEGSSDQNVLDSIDSAKSFIKDIKNELGIRQLEELGYDGNDKWSIVSNAFTKSPFFKTISTPWKRVLQGKYPNAVKEIFVKSFNDGGIALALNSVGLPSPNSVYQRIGAGNGNWVRMHDNLLEIWGKDTGTAAVTKLDINPVDIKRKLTRSDDTYSKWLDRLNKKRLKKEPMTDNEAAASKVVTEYFENAKSRLEETGQISTKVGLDNRLTRLESELLDLQTKLRTENLRKDKVTARTAPMLEARIKHIEDKIGTNRGRRIALDQQPDASSVDDLFFPRFWDKRAIKQNRESFSKILYEWYKGRPYIDEIEASTGKVTRVQLSVEEGSLQSRVDQTIDRIMGDEDPTSLEAAGLDTGMLPQAGRSKHFRHRKLDIPNELVLDYMFTDPMAAVRTYSARIEPRYEFAKQFGKDVDGVMFDLELEMIGKGYSTRQTNKLLREYRHMYDRVSGTLHREPATVIGKLDRGISNFLREAASFSYMGAAGFSALPDFGRIVLEYDLNSISKGMQELIGGKNREMATNEVRYAGEAIDIIKGLANMRITEDLSNNIDSSWLLNNTRNAFYTLNGLAPLTGIAKQFAGIVDGHTIIDYSIRYNSLTKMESTWLARYGIGAEDAAKIAKQPFQKTDGGLYIGNTDAWSDLELVSKYRVALNSGVLNVIMSGTPADKPIITDGVVYIPIHIAEKFGMKEDSAYKGYARFQSGFLSLPFQFYSYTLANINKTIGAVATGQVKNRTIGVATMLGLAYMSLSIRTPDYIWDEMEWQDKFARSFDTSGVMALYSDLFYTTMHTTMALGGENITGGFIAAKFPQKESTMDAIGGFAGAGPSWGMDMYRSVSEMANGNFGEGARDAVRALPFMRNYFIKDDINQLTRGWGS